MHVYASICNRLQPHASLCNRVYPCGPLCLSDACTWGTDAQDIIYLDLECEEFEKHLDEWFSPVHGTVMMHLPKHLVRYIERWGPVKSIWMFAPEDLFGYFKRVIKTRSHPVASIMIASQNMVIGDIALEFIALSRRVISGVADRNAGFVPLAVQLAPVAMATGRSQGNIFLDPADVVSLKLWMTAVQPYRGMKALWTRKVDSLRQRLCRLRARCI
jgi:hypothetical protein